LGKYCLIYVSEILASGNLKQLHSVIRAVPTMEKLMGRNENVMALEIIFFSFRAQSFIVVLYV
jgi:hypothetical protein